MPRFDAVPEDDFKRGMRRLAAAVNVVSTLDEGRPAGLIATAVCSVSAGPPSLLVCVNRGTRTHGLIVEAGVFCVNVLAADQMPFARQFLARDPAERFASCRWSTLATGSPALDEAMTNFDCEVSSQFSSGTHDILVGHVVAMRQRESGNPLLYFEGDYRHIGHGESA
ncbi:flavin reductase [Xanthobacter tagetidis]|jgi:flavin reductase (DIM6/NTAB) family NADH-FMN oxidoreductase RutF|nr:flavin reductase [Xanthobacter tagetidis]MBB6307406.1 flavin reductase [Xanthobacter tagetidis]